MILKVSHRTGEITLTVNGESNLYYFDPARQRTFPEKCSTMDGFVQMTTKGERWLYFKKGNIPADIGKYYKRGVVATSYPGERYTGHYSAGCQWICSEISDEESFRMVHITGTDSNGQHL